MGRVQRRRRRRRHRWRGKVRQQRMKQLMMRPRRKSIHVFEGVAIEGQAYRRRFVAVVRVVVMVEAQVVKQGQPIHGA